MRNLDTSREQLIFEVNIPRRRLRKAEKLQPSCKQDKEALEDSGETLRTILQHIDDVVFRLSPVGIIQYVSPRVKQIYGYKPEDLIGLHLKKTTPLSEVPKAIKAIKAVLSGKTIINFEINQLDANGKSIPVEINASPVRKNGKIVAVQGVMRDITKHRLAEEALQESEQKFRSLAEQSPNMIFINKNGNVVYANKRCEEVMGYKREYFYAPDFNFLTLIAPEYWELVKDSFNKHKNGEEVQAYDYVLINKKGERIDAILNTNQIKYGGGRAILGVVTDITERKKMERALRESEDQYRDLFENANDLIQSVSIDGSFLYVNKKWRETLSYREEEVASLTIWDIIHPDCLHHCRQTFQKVMSGETVDNVEAIFVGKGGKNISVEGNINCRYQQGKIVATRGIFRDITERKKMQDRIVALYEREKSHRKNIEEEAEARGLFINVLAHELKTPLTTILASLGLLKDNLATRTEVKAAKLVNNSMNAAKTLISRLDELLDLGRFTRGAFTVQYEPLNSRKFLEKITQSFYPVCQERKQKLILDLPQSLPTIEADYSRLEQVLMNLISNAIKFSDDCGEIIVRATTKDGLLVVEVEDNGIGITIEEQRRLFKPYHRVEQDRHRFPGLGLGLAVSKQIIEAHGGSIWLQSELGRGSIFGFSLPLRGKPIPENRQLESRNERITSSANVL